jgi:hypothetical protein
MLCRLQRARRAGCSHPSSTGHGSTQNYKRLSPASVSIRIATTQQAKADHSSASGCTAIWESYTKRCPPNSALQTGDRLRVSSCITPGSKSLLQLLNRRRDLLVCPRGHTFILGYNAKHFAQCADVGNFDLSQHPHCTFFFTLQLHSTRRSYGGGRRSCARGGLFGSRTRAVNAHPLSPGQNVTTHTALPEDLAIIVHKASHWNSTVRAIQVWKIANIHPAALALAA